MANTTDRITVLIDFVTNKAQQGMSQISKSTNQATGRMGKLRAGAGAAFSMIGTQGPLVAAAAGAAFVKFGNDAVNAAASQQEQINALNRTYEESAPAIRQIGEAAQESMGLSRTEFAQAAVSFSGFVEAITAGSGTTEGNLNDLMQRAADFGSRFELETSEALRIFRSALAGEIEPIRKFGIGLNAAAVEAHALEVGITAVGERMTEDQKIQARYSLLMEETANTQGDFAATSEDLVNSRKRLRASLQNMVADLGDILIPKVELATNAANDLVDVLQADIQLGDIKLGSGWDWLGKLAGFDITTPFTLMNDELNEILNDTDTAAEEIDAALSFMDGGAWQRQKAGYFEEWKDGLEAAEESAKEYGKAQEIIADEVEKATKAHRAEQDALLAVADARRDAAGLTLDWADANDAFIESVDEYNAMVEEGESTTRELAAATREVIRDAGRMVDIQLEQAGVTEDQAGWTEAWTSGMVDQAAVLSGPLQDALIAYASEVSGIPEERLTEIVAEVDPGSVGQAEDYIEAELSNLNAEVSVFVNEGSLAAALARIRTHFQQNQIPIVVTPSGRGGDIPAIGSGTPTNPTRRAPAPSNPRQADGGGILTGPAGQGSLTVNITGVSAEEAEAIAYGVVKSMER